MDVEDPRGDVLADVLGASLLRNAVYRPLECRAPWGLSLPRRDLAVFYLLSRGSALLEVEGSPAASLAAGDVAFVPHGSAHRLRDAATSAVAHVCDGKYKRRGAFVGPRRLGGSGALTSIITGFFELRPGRKPALLEALPRVVSLGGLQHPALAATVQLILAESMISGPASALVLQRLADVLFVQVLRVLSVPCRDRAGGLSALADPPISEALELLHGQVAAPWTVAGLASKVGLSRSAFAARFTELVGEPPLQYLGRWRMARAAELLRSGDDGVGTIATQVGYESVPSFTKAFKRWQGQSPGAFRRASARP